MDFAICGTSLPPFDKTILKKSHKIGTAIASMKHALKTGGCWGYPYEAAKGAIENNGRVIAVSPAKNKEQHIDKYKFPTENFTEIIYTGLGIPGRNISLVNNSDAVIIISGQIGTLNEFTIAFQKKKIIGILKGSGGITGIIKDIAEICGKNEDMVNIVYEKEPKRLIDEISKIKKE